MVINIEALEFPWSWKWNTRPAQRRMTVMAYYEEFYYCRDEMVRSSCPVDEEDYTEAFLENLRVDLKLRMSKRSYSRIRLSDALNDARFEERGMSMDARLEEMKLLIQQVINPFNEPMVFDEIPSLDVQKEVSLVASPKVFYTLTDPVIEEISNMTDQMSRQINPEEVRSVDAIEVFNIPVEPSSIAEHEGLVVYLKDLVAPIASSIDNSEVVVGFLDYGKEDKQSTNATCKASIMCKADSHSNGKFSNHGGNDGSHE